MRAHYLYCEAPICQGYPTENLLWYPDEKICNKVPYTKWQKSQIKIQKLYLKDQIVSERYFTVKMLERMVSVRKGIRGRNSNKPVA